MILVCPTAFKGTLSATEAAAAMAAGARAGARGLDVRVQPLSDGGNGLLNGLEAAAGGKGRGVRVPGPLGTSVTARYLVQDRRVVVETAEACGLHLVPEPLRDPMRTSTRGVGELLLAAREAAPEGATLVVGLGGSATVDAGAGMVTALGWRLLDASGDPIPAGGGGLAKLHRIEAPETPPPLAPMVVLADVTNPLLGSKGAAPVYAPQKGATAAQVARLEEALGHWASVVRRDLGRDVADLPGSGAAGGLGAAFAGLLGVDPQPGADWVLDTVGFDEALDAAMVVVTGEGEWNEQSSMGKVTGEVVRRARQRGIPVLLVTGRATAPVPDGVALASGEGDVLTARGLEARVSKRLPALLPRRRPQ
ncbi:MAG: glycerate kinase [Gemmatimonadota bacterium]|jgi:glycerate kinase